MPAIALIVAILAIPAVASAQVTTRNLELRAAFNDYPPVANSPFGAGYSACWSYVHGDGREYAVLGTTKGTAIYNVTDPDNTYFVDFIPGIHSAWREMKSYREWIYVVTEGFKPLAGDPAVAPGIQIIRMADPENPVLAATWDGSFNRAHTVSIDTTRALLICNGTNKYVAPFSQTATGLRILSLADPENPVETGWWPGGAVPTSNAVYVHDSVPIGTRLFASSIYSGIQRVIDIADPAAPWEIASWTYAGAFTHNAWPDTSGRYLYVTDEVNGEPLKVFDIEALPAAPLAFALTSNPLAIVHNAHVKGDELFLSNYTEGIRILDLADPAHPAEVAWADSYGGSSGGFSGVWEVCPYFPSGTVIASDMQSGLLVYRRTGDHGLLRVEVVDGDDVPLPGARVYLDTQGDSLDTMGDGVVRFGPDPGLRAVRAAKFGYVEASAAPILTAGVEDTIRLVLLAKPLGALSGTVRDRLSDEPLEDADVSLEWTPIHEHTDGSGAYTLLDVPSDVYRIEVARPGYIPFDFERAIGAGANTSDFLLTPAAWWEDFETAGGWTAGDAGDDASAGAWVRVEPLGTSAAGSAGGGAAARERPLFEPEHEGHEAEGATPGQVQPETDRTPGAGTRCWVTGQGNDPDDPGNGDLDDGRTTLTSPAFDLSGMSDPHLGWWEWFYTQFGHPEDLLAVAISNDGGAGWTAVDTTRGLHNHWRQRAVRVADHVVPTDQVRLRFVAVDGGIGTVVEAAVDDVTAWDLASLVGAPSASAPPRLALATPRPNPASGHVALSLTLPTAGPVEVAVFDVGGRRVRTLHRGAAPAGRLDLAWDGAGEDGRAAAAGLYFVRAVAEGAVASARLVRVR